MQVRVAIRDKVGADFTIVEMKKIVDEANADLQAIAIECQNIIRATIMEKASRPSGNLASGFYAHPIDNGWAVGDIDELDKMLPYWNHVDKGSEAIGANWKHYLPKGLWVDGRWVESEDGFSGIQPQSPIKALNYIAETLQKMEIVIPSTLKRSSGRTYVKAWGKSIEFNPYSKG